MAVFEGGCRCGAVRYRVEAEALPLTYTCHCRDCQTWTGSAFSQQAIVPEANFTVSGPLGTFDLPSSDGQRISHQFACPTCFNRVFNRNTGRPGYVIIRAGTFDRSDELQAVAHIWTRRKQPWVVLAPETPSWPEGLPPAELHPLLGL